MLEPGLVISGPLRGSTVNLSSPQADPLPRWFCVWALCPLALPAPSVSSCQQTGFAGLSFLCSLLGVQVALSQGLCPVALNEPFDQGAGDHLGLWVKVMVQAGTDSWLFPSTPTAWTTEQPCIVCVTAFCFSWVSYTFIVI